MNNYLFSPFKDDNEKIESFKQLQKDIKSVVNNNQLVLFIGRLESYYDNIISKLKSDYNNDMDASYDLDDKHSKIIEELKNKITSYKAFLIAHKEEIRLTRKQLNERVSCKDYESEANEYFAHNPKTKSVSFYMLDDDDECIIDELGRGIDDCIDPICTIYNDGNV